MAHAVLSEVEKTCLFTSAWRLKAVREAPNTSLIKGLDTSVEERAFRHISSEEPDALLADLRPKGMADFDGRMVVCRTLELDRLALSQPASQVVLLGCGMDLRPWRLSWPSPPPVLFEVDTPAVLALRERVEAAIGPPPLCCRRPVCGDLQHWEAVAEALGRAGFQSSQSTVWLAEGLLGYLTQEAMLRLFAGTKALSGPNSAFLASSPPGSSHRSPLMLHTTFEESAETVQRAKAAGWTRAEVLAAADISERYGVSFMLDLLVFRP